MPQVRTAGIGTRSGRGHILQSLFFIFIFCMAVYVLLQSSIFRVKEISVNGNKQLTKNELLALTGLSKDVNIFKANLKQAGERISLHPMIKKVEIKRDLPAKIIINVAERKPIGLLIDQGGFVIVGDDGCYLKKVPNLSTVNLPIMTGIHAGTGRPGQKITDERLKPALNYLLIMASNLRAIVSEINVSDLNNIRAFTIDGVEIKFGDNTRIAEKIRLFQEVISQKYQNRILYIDISYKGRPVIKFAEPSVQEKKQRLETEIFD